MVLEKLNKEFIEIIREIMYSAPRISNPFDRVKIMQWIRRLREEDDRRLENARIRNEYAHYLRIMLINDPVCLCMPFSDEPPLDNICPLGEVLTNKISLVCPGLPRTGPIQPVMCHKTEDGKAFITVKRCPEGGVFCYMAVASNPMQEN